MAMMPVTRNLSPSSRASTVSVASGHTSTMTPSTMPKAPTPSWRAKSGESRSLNAMATRSSPASRKLIPATMASAHSVMSGHTRTAMPAAISRPPEIHTARPIPASPWRARISMTPATMSETPTSSASTATDSYRLVSTHRPSRTMTIPLSTDTHQPLVSTSAYSMGRGGGGGSGELNPASKSVTTAPWYGERSCDPAPDGGGGIAPRG